MFAKMPNRQKSYASGLPRLNLPEPAAACHPLCLVSPGELRAWLSSLPTASPERSAEELLLQARLLAHYPGPLPRLRQMLVLLEDPVLGIDEAIAELMAGKRTELSDRVLAQLLPLHSELTLTLAQLHKRLVNDLLSTLAGPPPAVLYAAMQMLARHLRLELTQDAATPPQPWLDMLQLYLIAEFLDQTNAAVGTVATPDVHSLFFGNLLFLLADPMSLSMDATWRLYDQALSAAPQVGFAARQHNSHSLPVDMRGVLPPLTLARKPGLAGTGDCRWLDLSHLPAPEPTEAEEDPTPSLHGALKPLLEIHARRYPRFRRSAEYHVFVGFGSTYQRLAARAGIPTPTPAVPPARLGGAPSNPNPARSAHQLNHSMGGAAFVLEPGQGRSPQIGDLVLLEALAEHDPNSPAVYAARVRRKRQLGDGRGEIGVEKLWGNLQPLSIKGHRGSGRALFHPDADDERPELYVPPGTFVAGAVLELSGPNGRQRVRLIAALEKTADLERVQVTPIGG